MTDKYDQMTDKCDQIREDDPKTESYPTETGLLKFLNRNSVIPQKI